MTALKRRIAALISANGPISVAEYMTLCLTDPVDGYYTTREPFGSGGDFTTAPEISQMFGELVGVWIAQAWAAIGGPHPVTIAEIGPGRGTLMKDVVRTLDRIAPDLRSSARFVLIEVSERLRGIQTGTLKGSGLAVAWCADIGALPPGPLILVGNELFDALPVRHYVRTASGWRERMVDLDPERDGELRFVAGPGSLDAGLLPPGADAAPAGSIVELAPARAALIETIAERIARHGSASLFIDYGYRAPAVGDTLQALRRHAFDDPLAHPGEADLTAHVDFAALGAAARSAGLAARLLSQADFLVAMGLLERAGALGASADEQGQEAIRHAVGRLAGPDQMGDLFKVLMIARPGTRLPPFASA